MTVPTTLKKVADEALNIVHEHPRHEYLPADRLRFEATFVTLGTDAADVAYRWHAVLAAKRVLKHYQEPHYPESYYEKVKRFPVDEWKQVEQRMRFDIPDVAIDTAEQVLRGTFDKQESSAIVNETASYIGYYKHYQQIRAYFAEMASHIALSQATSSNPMRIKKFSSIRPWNNYSPTNWQWIQDGGADTVAYSFLAECCVIEQLQPIKNPEHSEYHQWTKSPMVSKSKSHAFWTWWLTDALEQAWDLSNPYIA